jgi:hypothetical protein
MIDITKHKMSKVYSLSIISLTLTQRVNVSAVTEKKETAGRVSVDVEPLRTQVCSFAAVVAAAASF